MSRERHTDALLDEIKPIFPNNVDKLNNYFNFVNHNGTTIKRLGERIDGFLIMMRPTTSDLYTWFWALSFELPEDGKKVTITIPWGQDLNRKDGSKLDRSIALYADNDIDPKRLEDFVEMLILKSRPIVHIL